MSYYLGIDGGGTKTHALVCDENGNMLGFGKAGCGNFEVFGWEHAKNEILNAMRASLEQAGLSFSGLSYAFFGVAGADRSYDHVMLKNEILKLNLLNNFNVKNDSFVALRGGTEKPYGVAVVSGTGTVAVGRNKKGAEHRAGGLGHDFGDVGSGPDIVKMAVKAVVRENDGRGGRTRLTGELHKIFKCKSTDEFIDRTYRSMPSPDQMALVIQSVYECAEQKDKIAAKICNAIAGEIALSAGAVIQKLNMKNERYDIVLAGSIHKQKGKILKKRIARHLNKKAPRCRLRYPAFLPVVGAALLAMEESGIKITARHYENIKETVKIIG